jgi:hypothetical protein
VAPRRRISRSTAQDRTLHGNCAHSSLTANFNDQILRAVQLISWMFGMSVDRSTD